jgi:hypothetical protein
MVTSTHKPFEALFPLRRRRKVLQDRSTQHEAGGADQG